MFLEAPPDQIVPVQDGFNLPKNYGKIDYSWYNKDKYHGEEVKIHEYTTGKQIVSSLRDKIKWSHLIAVAMLVVFGLMKTKGKKIGKIFIYNGSLAGVFLFIVMILIKTSKPIKKYKIKH